MFTFSTRLIVLFNLLQIQISLSLKNDEIGAIPIFKDQKACLSHKRPLYLTEPYGYIVSPNYDESGLFSYPDGAECSWTLLAPTDNVIMMKMMLMDLDRGENGGHLTFYDGHNDKSNVIDRFSGDRWRNFRSPHNILHIKFLGGMHEGSVPQHQGFRIYFEHQKAPTQCGPLKRCRSGEACISPENKCNQIDDCLDGSDEEDCPSNSSVAIVGKTCGWQNNLLTLPFIMQIVGGKPSRPDAWPWSVSIRLQRQEPEGHYCGGTLVDRQWVVTAAHCFMSDSDPRTWSLSLKKYRKLIRDPFEVTRYPAAIMIHPKYNRVSRENDIALIKMNAPISLLDTSIRPICLPWSKNLQFSSKESFKIIGWGETEGTSNNYVLSEADVPLVDPKSCSEWLGYPISDKMICAGLEAGGTDSCKGDSGGPLMASLDGGWTLVGITAFGSLCCGCPKSPGVYTKVTEYLEWINTTINSP